MSRESKKSTAREVLDTLEIQPFWETQEVNAFDCGNKDLNEFLSTPQVREFERESLGSTYLVFRRGTLVGFFTVSFGSLRVEYLKTWKSFSKMAQMKLDSIPALMIGRFAVDQRHQRQMIGTALIRYVAGMALALKGKMGVRLMILEAKRGSVEFYQSCGFELTTEVKRERGKVNRTMFFDLHAVADIA